MSDVLTARDLLPLIRKLTHDEQVRLARLALSAAAAAGDDAAAYRARPEGEAEFSAEDDALAWESEGWDDFRAPR